MCTWINPRKFMGMPTLPAPPPQSVYLLYSRRKWSENLNQGFPLHLGFYIWKLIRSGWILTNVPSWESSFHPHPFTLPLLCWCFLGITYGSSSEGSHLEPYLGSDLFSQMQFYNHLSTEKTSRRSCVSIDG